MRHRRWDSLGTLPVVVVAAALVLGGGPAAAQTPDPDVDPERRAQLQRQGGGLRLGAWWAGDREDGQPVSRAPYIEGYFQRGLDLHLALESTLSVWRQRRDLDDGRVDGYVVPLFTALKFYPTTPDRPLEPYVLGGLGLALGIEDRKTAGGLLGPSGGTSVVTGFGFRGGGGVDWRFSRAFGLHLAAAYNWVRFGDRLNGENVYRGPVATGGLVYRFQF